MGLDGKADSIKARRPELIAQLRERITRAEKVTAKLSLRPSAAAKLHQKKRRLQILRDKLSALQADASAGTVRLCFGSRRLFNAQFDLAANGFESHAAWQQAWQRERSAQFFVLGSQDESAGNQSCQAAVSDEGDLTLRLRLPDALVGHASGASHAKTGKHLVLDGVRFAYGHEALVAALATSRTIASTTKAGRPTVKRVGSALSYRFVRDDKGWRVFVSCEAQAVEQVSARALGAIGVDINADHLAISEIDRFGNPVRSSRLDLHTCGKTTEQAKALIGDAAVCVADWARASGKPIVVERLDFAKKKAELEAVHKPMARMLSSFACNKVVSSLRAAAFRRGVEVVEVNPAYTSVIGAVKYAQARGISVHMGAAVAVARRGLGLSEKPPARVATVPVRNGGHVTLGVPARNRARHVWSHWGKIRAALRAAHAAHFRSGCPQGRPAPLSPAMQTLGATRSSTAKSRSANRQQHCLAGVTTHSPLPDGHEKVWVGL